MKEDPRSDPDQGGDEVLKDLIAAIQVLLDRPIADAQVRAGEFIHVGIWVRFRAGGKDRRMCYCSNADEDGDVYVLRRILKRIEGH